MLFIIVVVIIITLLLHCTKTNDNFKNINNINCRKPTEFNPHGNSLYSDYISNNNIKACDDKKSRKKRDEIINKKFATNNLIPLNDFKLNKYYFYRVPNTYNIPNNNKFGKLLLSNNNKSGECKRFNKNCHLIR